MLESVTGGGIAQELNATTRTALENLYRETKVMPTLAMITAGDGELLKNSEFMLHVDLAKKLGVNVESFVLSSSASEAEVLAVVDNCNNNAGIHGILVLLPLPEQVNEETVLARIADKKELEGLNEIKTMELMFEGKQVSLIASLLRILKKINYDILRHKNVLLIEDEFIQISPVVQKLLQAVKNAGIPLDIVTTKNADMEKLAAEADLLLVSTDTPELVDARFVKEGAIVIDFNPIAVGEVFSKEKNKMVAVLKSSVNVPAIENKAKYNIPCLGGIGPIALATLMMNLLFNYRCAVLN